MRKSPSGFEALEVGPAALGAGTMPCCERNGFVGKKERRVVARLIEKDIGAVLGLERAGDPVPVSPPIPVAIAKAAEVSSIAHERTSGLMGDDFSKRTYSVLTGQKRRLRAILCKCRPVLSIKSLSEECPTALQRVATGCNGMTAG